MASSKNTKKRADELLVACGFARDLKHASSLILAGQVVANDHRVDHAGQQLSVDVAIRLKDHSKYVGRGGDKLESAMKHFNLQDQIKDTVVIDIGASTGGFTDYMLQAGAQEVYAVDVGTNQIDWKLQNDKRVKSFEKTDFRDFLPPEGVAFDWVLADISFNSLTQFIPAIIQLPLAKNARIMMLIKPQFELDQVEKGGVVRDEKERHQALLKVEEAIIKSGLPKGSYVDSAIKGTKGNQEIFYYIKL